MKKILFVMPNMLVGGVEKSLLALLEQLKHFNLDVDLMFVKKEGGFLNNIPSYVTTGELPLEESVKQKVSNIGTAAAIKKAIKCGRLIKAGILLFKKKILHVPSPELDIDFNKISTLEKTYDLAICYTTQNSFLVKYVAEKVLATKKIAWMHSSFFCSKYQIQYQKKCLEKYDKIFGVSNQTIYEFCKLIPSLKDKTDLFYNIVNENEILELANSRTDDFEGEIKIVTVGRLGNEKGQDLAIEAVRILKDEFKIKLFFIGQGQTRLQLEQLVEKYNLKESIVFLGQKSNPYPYMKNCDIYLQPSRFEGFCITLAEAKILGVPIVTTNFAGASEQIVSNETGLIVSANAKEIAGAIRMIASNEEIRKKFIQNLIQNKSSPQNHVYKLREFLE